jgi:hypothetical protein
MFILSQKKFRVRAAKIAPLRKIGWERKRGREKSRLEARKKDA